MISRKKTSEEQTEEQTENNDRGFDFKVKLSVVIGGKLIEADLDEALSIPTVDKLNPAVVSNMLAEVPSLHARWNFLYNEAVFEYDMLKTKIDVWISKKSQEYRRQLASGDGKVTEKMVDDTLKSDPEYKELNDDLAKSKKNMKHILAQANGFGEKGERLVTIASMMKWEAENLSGFRKTSNIKQYSHIKQDDDKHITEWPT